jgi:hypothetical protein
MPKRFSKEMRDFVINVLRQRDGDKCAGCGLPLFFIENPPKGKQTDIDHIDGRPDNKDPRNLRLMHHDCNRRAYTERVRQALAQQLGVTREREKIAQPPSPQDGYAPNKNYLAEPLFRRMCFAMILGNAKDGLFPRREDMVTDLAEYIGNSKQSNYNYLSKLLSPNFGPLELFRDERDGEIRIRFKKAEDYGLSVDQLEEKYPYEGRRTKA